MLVIKHPSNSKVFATGSVHLKKNSIVVTAGDHVVQGQKIGEVASAASSTGPHLHFEVWGSGFYELVDPWLANVAQIMKLRFGKMEIHPG